MQYGLIAEEVAQTMPDLAVFNDKGQPETVKYHLLPVLLLNEVQRQQKTILAQAEQAQRQQRTIEMLEHRLSSLEGQHSRSTGQALWQRRRIAQADVADQAGDDVQDDVDQVQDARPSRHGAACRRGWGDGCHFLVSLRVRPW